MIVFASEDVGNADPRALQVAVAASRAVEFVGLPECRINLSQAATYLALAPKSNAAYKAVDAALDDVRREGNQPPPAHLRDASYRGAKELGHGAGYKYPHASGGWVRAAVPARQALRAPLLRADTWTREPDGRPPAKTRRRAARQMRRAGPAGPAKERAQT